MRRWGSKPVPTTHLGDFHRLSLWSLYTHIRSLLAPSSGYVIQSLWNEIIPLLLRRKKKSCILGSFTLHRKTCSLPYSVNIVSCISYDLKLKCFKNELQWIQGQKKCLCCLFSHGRVKPENMWVTSFFKDLSPAYLPPHKSYTSNPGPRRQED